MNRINSAWGRVLLLSLACVVIASVSGIASATPLSFLGAPETVWWSDMPLFNAEVDFVAGTNALTITNAAEFTSIEIGDEYGPDGHSDFHYGTNGQLGGLGGNGGDSPVRVEYSLNATVDPNTELATGAFELNYLAPPQGLFPGDILDDYGIVAVPSTMLEGNVIAVEMGATGAGTLDVLIDLTGGFLQTGTNSEPTLAGVPYSTNGYLLLRISEATPDLPADWSASFTSTGAETDVLGVPEPTSLALMALGAMALTIRKRRAL